VTASAADTPGPVAPESVPAAAPTPVESPNAPGGPGRRLLVTRRELIGLLAITMVAAVVRFAHVAAGGPWDWDQGTELLALWTAMTTGTLPLYGPAATSFGSAFHHGALYYDLLLPVA